MRSTIAISGCRFILSPLRKNYCPRENALASNASASAAVQQPQGLSTPYRRLRYWRREEEPAAARCHAIACPARFAHAAGGGGRTQEAPVNDRAFAARAGWHPKIGAPYGNQNALKPINALRRRIRDFQRRARAAIKAVPSEEVQDRYCFARSLRSVIGSGIAATLAHEGDELVAFLQRQPDAGTDTSTTTGLPVSVRTRKATSSGGWLLLAQGSIGWVLTTKSVG